MAGDITEINLNDPQRTVVMEVASLSSANLLCIAAAAATSKRVNLACLVCVWK